jgi:hypothetical protein
MGGVTYIPPQQDQLGNRAMQLMNIGLALEDRKKQDAMRTIEGGFKLMDMGIDPDYQQMTKAAKQLGYPLPRSPEEWKASDMRKQMTPTPNVPPNQAAATGGALQAVAQGGKAGMQASAPPSRQAASAAPGGGVTTPSVVPTPTMQSAVAGNLPGQAPQGPNTTMSVEGQAPNPFEGYTAGRRETMALEAQKAHRQAEEERKIADITDRIQRDPNSVSPYEMGWHYAKTTGMQLQLPTQEYMQATPEQRQRMIEYAAGAETDSQKAQRVTTATTSLINGGKLEGLVANRGDIGRVATAIAETGKVPTDVELRRDMRDIMEEQELVTQYVSWGIPLDLAHRMATATAMGGNPMDAVPEGMRTNVQEQMANGRIQAQAQALTANAAWLNAQSNMKQAESAMLEIQAQALQDPRVKEALDVVQALSIAKKNGGDVSNKVWDTSINNLTQAMGWQDEQKRSLFVRGWNAMWGVDSMRPGAPTTEEELGPVTGGPAGPEAAKAVEEAKRQGRALQGISGATGRW